MKTKRLYLTVIITIIVLFIIWLFERPTTQWKRPKNVPISAIWKGHFDGGSWLELVEIKKDTIRLRIYRDWNGDLLLDADFVTENGSNLQWTKDNWSEYISFFDGNVCGVSSKIAKDSIACRLIPISPVYYKEGLKK